MNQPDKSKTETIKNTSNDGLLHILGSGSALPMRDNYPTSQILELRNKQFMIDCGEGCQIRLREMGLSTSRLGHIFISHLHGDHCLGLVGLISTLGMMNRTADLYIHSHPDLERLTLPLLNYFCAESPFKIIFVPFNPSKHSIIYEDRSIEVYSIPLIHRVPTAGFLFQEKEKPRHIKREMIDFYNIPIASIHKIKMGENFQTLEGEVIPNSVLTTPSTPPLRYAFCSDTAYNESIIPFIEGVDLLYHEATFAESELLRAKKTMHSTARQAAEIAKKANVKKLIIGHFSARYRNKEILLNEARSVFKNTLLAEDKKTYPFF